MDFDRAPPGLLALDNMIYFAQSHKETYIKVRTSDTCICFLSLCIGYLYLFSIPVYGLFVSVFYPCVWVICICFLSLCLGYLYLFSIPVYGLFVSVFYPCVWVICIIMLKGCDSNFEVKCLNFKSRYNWSLLL